MDDIFEDLYFIPKGSNWDLATDIYEDNGNLIIEMNIPGIEPDKIDIKVEDNHLHIFGTREEKNE